MWCDYELYMGITEIFKLFMYDINYSIRIHNIFIHIFLLLISDNYLEF